MASVEITRHQVAEAAAVMRRLLAAVESGEIDATTPQAGVLLRRLEGAARTLEIISSK
jgi:predicted transcriptional regulator